MNALPPATREELRKALRERASAWVRRFYRHELLVARTVRGMQIEAQQEYDREIVRPMLREVGARLADFEPRGNDIVADAFPQLRALELEMEAIVHQGSGAVRRLTTERLDELSREESDWVADSVERELEVEPVQPSLAQEREAVDRPWLGARTDEWFETMLAGPTGTKARAWLQTGIQRGLSTDEIVRGLRGTRTQAGILEQPRHAVAALVRSAATHASSQTRMETFQELGVTHWRFVATLDLRTSPQCRANDGKVFRVGEGPVPPLHPNCRSTPVPDFGDPEGTRASADGQVPADTTFAKWLETRSREEQNQVLGKTKATAWRSGKLTLEQMLGRDLEPLTVAELKRLDRL